MKYTDETVKRKSHVPGVGLYNPESALDKISKGVTARKH